MDKAASVVETLERAPLILKSHGPDGGLGIFLHCFLVKPFLLTWEGDIFLIIIIIMYLLVCDNRYADFLKACSVTSV